MYLEINKDNPQQRLIDQVVKCLKDGGLVIYPTDSVYGIGCDLFNQKAIEKLIRLKQIKPNKMDLSFLCHDLSHISEYAKHISTPVFKMIRACVPGPYTFILESSTKVPKILGYPKKTVGIRVPDCNISRQIVLGLGNPLISSSVKDEDEILQYTTDPQLIYEKYKNLVDIVIDGGHCGNVPSTVISCVNDEVEVIREGLGDVSFLI
jgi:tRNA threonylcarbamoyl adenosine modification protein (Sua5/YciO/YrdC/YwlC family)